MRPPSPPTTVTPRWRRTRTGHSRSPRTPCGNAQPPSRPRPSRAAGCRSGWSATASWWATPRSVWTPTGSRRRSATRSAPTARGWAPGARPCPLWSTPCSTESACTGSPPRSTLATRLRAPARAARLPLRGPVVVGRAGPRVWEDDDRYALLAADRGPRSLAHPTGRPPGQRRTGPVDAIERRRRRAARHPPHPGAVHGGDVVPGRAGPRVRRRVCRSCRGCG